MARRSSPKSRRSTTGSNRNSGWRKFFVDHFSEVKKQNPSMKSPEIMKKIGEMWRQRSDATKNQYESTENKKGQSSTMKHVSQQSNKENQNVELSE